MTETTLYPTHSCFDDAIEYIEHRLYAEAPAAFATRADDDAPDIPILVHAICVAPDGTRYAHAWVEEQQQCWEGALHQGEKIWFAVPRDEHEAWRRPEQTTRYTLRQVGEENRRTGTYGPWDPAYLALVGRGDTRVFGSVPADATGATIRTWGSR